MINAIETDFDESLNVDTILNYWDDIAQTIAPSLDPTVLFLPVDVGDIPKVWPLLTRFDWWPKYDIEARIKRLKNFEFDILRLTYSDRYLFDQTGGTVHTACHLGANMDDTIMVKAIWIQAFVRNLQASRHESWWGQPSILSNQVESLFHRTKYKVEWHHAMRQILPLTFDDFGSLADAKPNSVKELIEMAVLSTTLCLAKYQLIEYYPKQW